MKVYWFLVYVLGCVLFSLSATTAVVIVAWHFIAKWW